MSVLEQYRAVYQKHEEQKNRHRFSWAAKKTERKEEESLDFPLGLMSSNGNIRVAAAKDLAEGIEMWLNPLVIPKGGLHIPGLRGGWYGL